MGTENHSKASKQRWAGVSKAIRAKRMGSVSKSGWDKLDPKARRRRALKSARTKKLLKEKNLHE